MVLAVRARGLESAFPGWDVGHWGRGALGRLQAAADDGRAAAKGVRRGARGPAPAQAPAGPMLGLLAFLALLHGQDA